MDNVIKKAHEVLADRILQDFESKITGNNEEVVLDQNPENKFFVGKLCSNQEDSNSRNGSDVYIESIGLDFYISAKEFENASIRITPRGDFYYRQYPTLDEQRLGLLNEVNESFSEQFSNFEELVSAYNTDKKRFNKSKIKLRPVYRKQKINENNEFHMDVKLSELMDDNGIYGILDEKHEFNILLNEHITTLKDQILLGLNNEFIYPVLETTGIKDLLGDDEYNKFLEQSKKVDFPINQNWYVYIYITIKKIKEQYLISVSLINDSRVQSDGKTHQSRSKKDDKATIETLFNAGLDVQLFGAKYDPIVLDYFLDDYKYDKCEQAIGQNCSVVYDDKNEIVSTNNLPVYIQRRLVTNDKLAVKFQDLIDNPIATLRTIMSKMENEKHLWMKDFLEKEAFLTPKGKAQWNGEIKEFGLEISRFAKGLELLESYPILLKSFVLMNKAFKATSKKYSTWRLFQVVFIVSLIPDIAACDENLLLPEEKAKSHLDAVSLLYFPTGGGKTEAFLGVLVFNLFFDRFRGKSCGVTSILRYPLRLLSVQQVQRLANTLAQAELLRRNTVQICTTEEFSLGYFVGDGNTPNKISMDEAKNYASMSLDEIDKQRVIDICPFCGKKTVHLKFDVESHRLAHFCENKDCESKGLLPIFIVDNEIYRFLPSAIISTVDKLAIVGNNKNFRNILSGVDKYCPKHGFTSSGKCLVDGCKEQLKDISKINFVDEKMYDPAPSLFIQDELHLIRESLGTYASHYESFINYYVKNMSPSRRGIKVIGATATISSYEDQIRELYSKDPIRFPCASPYVDHNFYAFIDPNDIQRRILGYAPFGKAIINAVAYSLKYMRQVVANYLFDYKKVLAIPNIGITTKEDALKILEDYWIFLEYNNVKRDGNNIEGALETPINVELAKENISKFITRKMTGDETFQDVREVLAEVEQSSNVFDGLNLIVATSMISHGVDADRFNIMFFFGVPGNVAEYIQAYSRTGRMHSSIVIDIIRPSRETDQSYLKNFCKFHSYKDLLVEPVPINRWANKAIDSTLPGIFAALLLNHYDKINEVVENVGTMFLMKNIKKAIIAGYINKDTVKLQLQHCYVCDLGEIGNLYKQSIDQFVERIFEKIEIHNWIDEMLFDGFKTMGYVIMNSLRNTDQQLIIELT